jgi:uncharacterized protein YxjI
MRLQINKRVFSLGDQYDVTDSQGNPVYRVQGHLFALGKKLDLLDMAGNEVAKIHQRLLSLVSEYDILQGDQVVAVVKKRMFSLFHARFTVEGPGGVYEMEGDWINWNYEIRANGQTVAQISQQFSLVQDRYGMEIVEGANVPLLLCLAIVIDEVSHPND